jgi:hypothetical protein
MLGFITALFKNPITSLVVDKTVGAIQHHLEVKKLERIAEIESAKTIQVQQVISSEKSWKDEWLTVFTTIGLTMCFIPNAQPFMIKGFEIIKSAPSELLYAVLVVYCGSFGLNVMEKFKK